ncbi:MAG: RpoL/Rpb11 RNA polymerase subunit family protein [Candidatus Caldarchaeum sp.]|nr:hypothetical protein [Candidatus Caldarchaeum sp.]MCS7133905.1 hypothetical protein [Candidatus Caldarchaeum sp.]MCX8202010.1 hypothetical protein [Candidatus Caldarchaeum sp.]MDW8062813.1 RpoL/Rpb11 RNA polymerase subunit family protein [Candidatus Caldarchaeum sp.]MDW8435188.1 RpoL/Rpb11 RNA polymerase subunit family protein [Candidatus Caldarchaeum sp.]
MKLEIIEEKDDFMIFMVSDVDQSIVNLLTETLNSLEPVLYAGYRVEHPLTGKITISLKVDSQKSSPRKSLLQAFEILEKMFQSVDKELEVLR